MPLELFPFRYCDPLTGKWVKARYVAERHEIAARYKEWEITGPPEIREGHAAHGFRPFPPARVAVSAIDRSPTLTPDERYFVLLFLRRYVTYCARRRRFAQMEGAARLARRLAATR